MLTLIFIGILFVMLEAIFDATMDTVDHHQKQSIFSKMKNQLHTFKIIGTEDMSAVSIF